VKSRSSFKRTRISFKVMSSVSAIRARRKASWRSSLERRAYPWGRATTVPVVVSAAIQRIVVATPTPKRAVD